MSHVNPYLPLIAKWKCDKFRFEPLKWETSNAILRSFDLLILSDAVANEHQLWLFTFMMGIMKFQTFYVKDEPKSDRFIIKRNKNRTHSYIVTSTAKTYFNSSLDEFQSFSIWLSSQPKRDATAAAAIAVESYNALITWSLVFFTNLIPEIVHCSEVK